MPLLQSPPLLEGCACSESAPLPHVRLEALEAAEEQPGIAEVIEISSSSSCASWVATTTISHVAAGTALDPSRTSCSVLAGGPPRVARPARLTSAWASSFFFAPPAATTSERRKFFSEKERDSFLDA